LRITMSKSKPTLEAGEQLPPMAGNVVTTFLFSCMAMLIACGFALVTLKLKLEDKIKAVLPANSDPLALPMAAGLLHIFVLQWLGMMVNAARSRYNVPWPWLYAEKSHPHAIEYNCAQRAHQHYLEQTVMAAIVLVIAGSEFPNTAGAGIIVFTSSKITGNILGYGSGKASRRSWGAWGYLGLLPVIGLSFFAVAHKFGIDSAPLVDNVAEHSKLAAAATYDTIQPLAAKAAETCKPYVQMVGEAARPYVDKAMENEYVSGAATAATAYATAASAAAQPYVEQLLSQMSGA